MRPKNYRPPSMKEIYERLTKELIAGMEAGTAPWIQPWKPAGAARNLVTGKPYRGYNQMLLSYLGNSKYESPYWLTFNQALDLGGNVKKGEKSTTVVFWKFPDKGNAPGAGGEEVDADDTGMVLTGKVAGRGAPLLRYYCVFNADQCENLKTKTDLHPGRDAVPPTPTEAQEAAQGIMDRADLCPIKLNGRDPCYVPSLDEIWLPKKAQFPEVDDFYHVAFHEMAHATGHKSRLGRLERSPDATADMRRGSYAREELVAEMSAAFLASAAGLDMTRLAARSAAYLKTWASRCREEPELLVKAAQQAQKACDWVFGVSPELARRRAEKDASITLPPPVINPADVPVPAYTVEESRPMKAGDVVRYYQPGTSDFATGVLTGETERTRTIAGLLDLPKAQVISLATKEQAQAQELYVAVNNGVMTAEEAKEMSAKWAHLNLIPVQSRISGNWICAKPQGYPVQNVIAPAKDATLYTGEEPIHPHEVDGDVYLGQLHAPEGRAELYFCQRGGKTEVAVVDANGCTRCKDPKGMAPAFVIAHDRANHMIEAQRSIDRERDNVEAPAL